MNLLSFVLAGASYLDPTHDHTVIASAITEVVEAERPLFRDDLERYRTAAQVLAVGWREGSLRPTIHGDCKDSSGRAVVTPSSGTCERPHSFCFLQIHDSNGGTEEMNTNPLLCVRKGLATLRTSLSICPQHPISFYASGPNGCENARAQNISRDRVALARRIYLAVKMGR